MQSLGNTEWLLNRAASKPAVVQIGALRSPNVSARELVLPAINGVRLIPSWAVFATILLASTAICGTAIIRARAELNTSSVQRQKIESEIQNLREANQGLLRDIQRLTRDPSAIEFAARERLGLVRASDIVVTREPIQESGNVSKVSFVR